MSDLPLTLVIATASRLVQKIAPSPFGKAVTKYIRKSAEPVATSSVERYTSRSEVDFVRERVTWRQKKKRQELGRVSEGGK